MAGRYSKLEIDLRSIAADPSVEVVERDDSLPQPSVPLFAGLDEPPEIPYGRARDDPGGLAPIWEAVARS